MNKYTPSLTEEQRIILQKHWAERQRAIVSDTQEQLRRLAIVTATTDTATTPERILDRQK
jgi:hypothetical protein